MLATIKHLFGIYLSKLEFFIERTTEENFSFGKSCFNRNRLICFPETMPSAHYIDFQLQPLKQNGWYFIPAYHDYFLPSDSSLKLICFTFPMFFGSNGCRFFWENKYASEHFFPDPHFNETISRMKDKEILIQAIWLFNGICGEISSTLNVNRDPYLFSSFKFMDALLEQPLNLDKTYIPKFACSINLSERQLRRVCEDVFLRTPSEIVRHHLLVQMSNSLISRPNEKLSVLALQNGFEHETGFTRFFRNGFGESPSAFKERFLNY